MLPTVQTRSRTWPQVKASPGSLARCASCWNGAPGTSGMIVHRDNALSGATNSFTSLGCASGCARDPISEDERNDDWIWPSAAVPPPPGLKAQAQPGPSYRLERILPRNQLTVGSRHPHPYFATSVTSSLEMEPAGVWIHVGSPTPTRSECAILGQLNEVCRHFGYAGGLGFWRLRHATDDRSLRTRPRVPSSSSFQSPPSIEVARPTQNARGQPTSCRPQ